MKPNLPQFITKDAPGPLHKAFSRFTLKSLDDGTRILTGIATTPSPDRVGDVVVPEGIQFKTPFPLLFQHDPERPIGTVTKMTISAAGAEVEATIAAAGIAPYIDEAYALIKAGLVPGLSIGFRPIEYAYNNENDGYVFSKSEIFELSAVTIPANADANIQTIKSHDRSRVGAPVVRLSAPKPKETKTMNIAEQLKALVAKRNAANERKKALMEGASADGGRTLSEEESTEYDTLTAEVEALDTHEKRLKSMQEMMAKAGVPVSGGPAHHNIVSVTPNVAKGTAFTRYAIALMRSKGNIMQALEVAKEWKDTTPEVEVVLKAAVAAGNTTDPNWAGPLVPYQNMTNEFIELLRPQTIVGRIQGFRRVPFNIRIPGQLTGSTVNWVGEGKPKPVSALSFDTTSLGFSKVAGIVVMTDELVRWSSPSAEALVQQDLVATISQFLDGQFIDPTKAAGANGLSPASVTNGVTPIPATAVTEEAIEATVEGIFEAFIAANLSVTGAVWIMSETLALKISMLKNAMAQQSFPGLSMAGGTFYGLPVILSQTAGNKMILINASEVLLADDGGVVLDSSREASIEMDSAPTGGPTELVSLWQNGFVALKAERFINWKRRRTAGVQYADFTAALAA